MEYLKLYIMRKELQIKKHKLRGTHHFGVYMITCIPTGQRYIGSSWYSVSRRIDMHRSLLNRNKHSNTDMQKMYNIHGLDNFYFTTLEVCSKEMCIEREQYHMDDINPEFNIQRVAGLPTGNKNRLGKKFSPETLLKMSKSKKGKPNGCLGKTRSIETRNKISDSLKNRSAKLKNA